MRVVPCSGKFWISSYGSILDDPESEFGSLGFSTTDTEKKIVLDIEQLPPEHPSSQELFST